MMKTRQESCRFSMFFNKRRDKLSLEKRSLSKIPTKWKLVIAVLIGSGTGLIILTMCSPGSINDKSSCNETSKSTTAIQFVERMANAGTQNDEKSSAYCTIGGCNTVTCLSIPESLNPGLVASDFITQIFKAQCPNSNFIEQLTFQLCTFPNNRLKSNWLTIDLPLKKLTLRDCSLEDFAIGSFASSIFANLETLDVSNGKIKILQKRTFDDLKNLKNLLINENIVHQAELNLLSSIADSLEILVLDGCLRDINVLANITSYDSLSKIQILSIQRNSLRTITSNIFKSLTNVVSMYLGQSEIEEIDVDALKNTRSLKLLDIKSNLLKKLPYDMLTTILTKNPDFKISMTENPWNCSCEFAWISKLMKNYPGAMTEIPKCETPERNAFLYFTNAQFCDDDSTFDSTTLSTTMTTTSMAKTTRKNITNEDEEKLTNYVKFTCRNYESLEFSRITRKLLSTIEEWKFPSRFQDFSVKPLDNGDILINLKIRDNKVSLIWFRTIEYEDEIEIKNDTSSLSYDKIDCVKNIENSFVIKNLIFDASYTICLLENLSELPSPLNCLAAKTRMIGETASNNVWLTNDDKSIVIGISIFLLIFMSFLSVLTAFWVIRKNPSLLRGSKRIIMVRNRAGIEALIMPHDVTNENSTNDEKTCVNVKQCANVRCLRKNFDTNYLTPREIRKTLFERKNSSSRDDLPTARRKDSKVSRVSSGYSGWGSYVSGIEATPSELYNWRNNTRRKNYYTACMENDEFEEIPSTPPLPPHRSYDNTIPSLSLAVDTEKEDREVFSNFYIDRDNDDQAESLKLRK